MVLIQSDLRSVIQIAATFCYLSPTRVDTRPDPRFFVPPTPSRLRRLFTTNAVVALERSAEKPSICTADELHYVSVNNSDWRLALWRYKPPPKAPKRNHPLLLLSGVGTNAVGFDLAPESSFARSMSKQGFDTWILELRGAGLSSELKAIEAKKPLDISSGKIETNAYSAKRVSKTDSDSLSESNGSSAKSRQGTVNKPDAQPGTKFGETFQNLSERLSVLINDGLLEARRSSVLTSQFRDLSQRLANIFESRRSFSPQFTDLVDRFSTSIEDIQKQIDLIAKYNWDFDHYLEEDVPAAMEYILSESKPKDGKLLAIGHSMGGILLYAMLSRNSYKGENSKFASVVTLGSSLDYTTSNSSLRLILPLATPAQALSVPVIPLGALLAVSYPLANSPPYVMSWLKPQISAENMMQPELLERLVLNNFCTIPAKLLLQLKTCFDKTGLSDRSGTFFYKDHLYKIDVPVLAVAGDKDLICPPEAVYETLKVMPERLVTYKVFGEPGGPHYGHYDLVGGRKAPDQVYPFIIEFLIRHDGV